MTVTSINTIIYSIIIIVFVACSNNRPPLNSDDFTSLLIDLHIADGTLATTQINISDKENKTYTYYNWIYEKYRINESLFNSCVVFYVAQPDTYLKIYDKVLDSLNKLVTHQNQILQNYKSNDSLNYFSHPNDTLFITQEKRSHHIIIDSLTPGYYSFSAQIKFNKQDLTKNNRITSMFISADNNDTLRIRDIAIIADTARPRKYNWKQYIDSVYTRLEITMFDTDNPKNISKQNAKIWDITLFKSYISQKTEKGLQNTLNINRSKDGAFTNRTEQRPLSQKHLRHDRGSRKINQATIDTLQLAPTEK